MIDQPALMVNPAFAVGGKAKSLAKAQLQGLPVPRWFVVLPPDELRHQPDAPLALSPAVHSAILEMLESRFKGIRFFAVRSSAHAEDGDEHSFAGMFESYLFIPPEQVAQKVLEVWQSAFTPRVQVYYQQNGLAHQGNLLPAVIIQEMIEAEKSGVAFSADPISGSRHLILISATLGVGSSLVSGECDGDAYHVTADGEIVQQQIARKTLCHLRNSLECGIMAAPIPMEQQLQSTLSYGEALSVAGLAKQASAVFGAHQDIEWCIRQGRLYLLQSRPITTLPPALPPEKEVWHLWSNASTIESWPGVCTPLTFALAQHMMATTYRELTRYTCLPKVSQAHYDFLYPMLTGHLRGSIYLDMQLLNQIWFMAPSVVYRFSDCRQYTMAVMDRFKRAASSVETEPIYFSEIRPMFQKGIEASRGLIRLVCHYRRLPSWTKSLNRRVAGLRPPENDASVQVLWCNVQSVLRLLRDHWQAPTLNTYYTNQMLEILVHLAPDTPIPSSPVNSQHSQLSYQFMHHLGRLSGMLRKTPHLAERCINAPLEEIETLLNETPQVKQALAEFLEQFGDRCDEDTKLESIPWSDNPLSLLRTMGIMAQMPQEKNAGKTDAPSSTAHPVFRSRLQKFCYQWLLKEYQKNVIRREHLRLLHTRSIAVLRRNLMALDRLLVEQGVLQKSRDILWLDFKEIEPLIPHSGSSMPDLKAVQETINLRQKQHAYCLTLPPLPDQFKAWGPLLPEVPLENAVGSRHPQTTISGQACSPGQVTGEVVWYSSQANITAYKGKILAAPFGDPGLVNIYPLIQGLLLERGSVLSHPAIVARELQIPTIVCIPGLNPWLENGEIITMDGSTGRISRVLEGAETP